jgi:hypothetical protein
VNGTGGSTIADYGIKLFYDLDPGASTSMSEMGVFDFSGVPIPLVQDSQNATFGVLGGLAFPGLTPPTFTAFDPLTAGEYSFAIVAEPAGGTELGGVAINVNVNAVPVPATLALLGLGLFGIGIARRKS